MGSISPILVVGQTGQVARCLQAAADEQGISLVSLGRPTLDIASRHSIERAIDAIAPAAIINAAAYTAVDKAESDPEEAFRINCTGPSLLARAAAERRLPFIHISTDYVFDGTGTRAYREDDPAAPLGVYGRSKREGEIEVLSAHPAAVVVRTSWVYSAHGTNFLRTMMRLAETHPVVRVVNDQHGAPTSAHMIAPALLKIAAALLQPRASKLSGIYHLTADGGTTWFGFATAIFSELKERGQRSPDVVPISTAEYPTPAKRPHYSVLDSTRVQRGFDVRLPHWRQSLTQCLDQIEHHRELQPC